MSVIRQTFPLGLHWPTMDPFLFCAHHLDIYPRGTAAMAPDASLAGRPIGSDFEPRDGWRMYHGDTVPGFPAHPHRGFETVTYARQGVIDHSDSLGATARFGAGDVQWLTAGRGIVHAEMFPLLDQRNANPAELFQIWLNLPAADKMTEPHFSMLWAPDVPVHRLDAAGDVAITTIAGALGGVAAPPPPPASWAARADSDVAIWHIELAAGASWRLPAAAPGSGRVLYAYEGAPMRIAGERLEAETGARVDASHEVELAAPEGAVNLMMLQGRPIGEPVAQYGPFVMNDREGVEQAFADYQRTHFGGWPWPVPGPVHPRTRGRFAQHGDGRVEDDPRPLAGTDAA